ncbi:CorA family divalent cation transporter [Rhodosalinus sp.]|uniref:CorA family divalent cation transporter n=1 Tax=Rhodosalinus sp. TaxID=2047741 RepID=UPI003566A358
MIRACHLSDGGLAEAGGVRTPGLHGRDGMGKSALRDLRPIAGPAGFLQQKTGMPRDATRGFINIAQAAIIKIFSVVAVLVLPPTLIASIHGRTFAVMPELGWRFGYPAALGLMVAAAVAARVIFRRKGWV